MRGEGEKEDLSNSKWIYVSETARSLYERAKEHVSDLSSLQE